MNLVDRAQGAVAVGWFVWRYDLALDVRGVSWRQRGRLRRELRANLTDAAADVGWRAALAGVGTPRGLVADLVADDGRRPRWSVGSSAAALVLALTLVVLLVATIGFTHGVQASGAQGEVAGPLGAFPGVRAAYTADPTVWSVSLQGTWAVLVLPALAFLGFARPWRLVLGRRGNRVAGAH